MRYTLTTVLFLCSCLAALAQSYSVSGTITNAANGQPVPQAEVLLTNTGNLFQADASGKYSISNLAAGTYTLTAYSVGLGSATQQVIITNSPVILNFILKPLEGKISEVKVKGEREKTFGITRLNSVEGTAIYEGKKSEVVVIEDISANKATNNSRQVFAKVAGLNIWESDGAGLQLGIGGRGLSPNRTSNFNTRQNGYDISADALGYPESYYTPPVEALDRIEVVRGAASLQYGTQFGGMINFVMKEGPEDKPFELTTRQTVGSWGLFNSFNSVGGSKGKFHYYGFYQYKRGDGWRDNSNFDAHTAFSSIHYKPTDRLEIGFDYTFMDYLAQQPGGLTDAAFAQDARQSVRNRNWFKVKWNLLALTLDYRLSERTKLNIRNFGLLAQRDALGYLEKINRADPMRERLLLQDQFNNFGNETRLITRYNFLDSFSTLLVGARYYHGLTDQKQGNGSSRSDSDFRFYSETGAPSQSSYDYLSRNVAVFAENIFNITPTLSVTPGARYEWINTNADGSYREVIADQAGNVIRDETKAEDRSNSRNILLLGLGLSYKPNEQLEVYGNFSQNYRAINFNDMRVVNPNQLVDQNLQDESGYTSDLGVRGNSSGVLNYDVSLFYLAYKDRISSINQVTPNYQIQRVRTNVGDSYHYGLETFVEADLLKLYYGADHPTSLSAFSNITYVYTTYESSESDVDGKNVELAPAVIAKAGLAFKRNNFKLAYQYSYTAEQYTDPANSILEPTAVVGIIPAYWVMDLSGSYTYGRFTLETGINNLTDNRYFTRRATGYPGPGIIPSDARSFYLSLQFKL
ncbi:TonB-dependent receptor [Pontibacter akesuensis]|uniref:Fe(3+) dicitrate transport protein n=1 Tax=Pontibacter akesuensis TaxID=388950 RepID=A0A1I7HSX4_9BACT|nr:TonB-dependent receptor [Pontibacter akesuensis]GHA63329.1 TonB-dependent receptor [Pontibacter akesuensis]SFU63556.1 Fe(3+) dicitrate transport protein [Pontibacter akesuensis]